jgi:hypothetical protein
MNNIEVGLLIQAGISSGKKDNTQAEEWLFYDLLEYCEERFGISASELLKDFNKWLEKN